MDPLKWAGDTAVSALLAQSMRMRVVSENIANADSTGKTPGSDPYRRKTIAFAEELDKISGANLVGIDSIGRDPSDFRVEYQPGHPAADAKGMVKLPNVNMIVEMSDMRQATRAYEANLQVIRQSGEMKSGLIDLLRGN